MSRKPKFWAAMSNAGCGTIFKNVAVAMGKERGNASKGNFRC